MESFDDALRQARSPLEERFLIGLLASEAVKNKRVWHAVEDRVVHEVSSGEDPFRLTIQPQTKVGPYFSDFLLVLQRSSEEALLCVEVDGHAFHERTKQQAAHDKRRDRLFAAKGLVLIRFTGSEVYADNLRCASEAIETLGGMFNRRWRGGV